MHTQPLPGCSNYLKSSILFLFLLATLTYSLPVIKVVLPFPTIFNQTSFFYQYRTGLIYQLILSINPNFALGLAKFARSAAAGGVNPANPAQAGWSGPTGGFC